MKKLVVNVLVAVSAFCLAFVVWGMSTVDSIDADEDAEAESLKPVVPPKPRDIIIISVDTLRADRLGPYGYETAETPVLDDLARSGMVFEHATVPLPRTTPALASMLTGLSPQNHGSREVGEEMTIAEEQKTLAEVMVEQGFQTIGVSSNGAASEKQHFGRGFQHFLDRYGSRNAKRGQNRANKPDVQKTGSDVSAKAIALLEKMAPDKPVFMWVHYVDPHWTYGPPSRFNPPEGPKCKELQKQLKTTDLTFGSVNVNHRGLAEKALQDCSALYDSEVSYSDLQVGKIIDALKKTGRYQHALIVFTSDHGENLGEDGYYYDHGPSLNDASLRVPLILAGPGIPKGKRDHSVTRIEDLMPTLLTVFEIDQEVWPQMDGRDFSWRWRDDAELPPNPVKYAVSESGSALRVTANEFLVSGRNGSQFCVNAVRYSACKEPGKLEPIYFDRAEDPFFESPLKTPPQNHEQLLAGLDYWKPETARSRAVRTPQFKLVEYPQLDGSYRRALYDLENDPHETVDVQEDHPKVVADLQQVLDRWTQGLPLYQARERAPDEIENLRALGYIQ